MNVLLFTHDACSLHDAGPAHPERPARLDAALAGVRRSGAGVDEREAPWAALEHLVAVHDPSYVAEVKTFLAAGGGAFDADTRATADSWEAALRAAGAGPAAAAALRAGDGDAAFLAVRPPGHHATADQAMGFCLFNNLAVTAALLAAEGDRVAVFDWDVHHGNGTQDLFWHRDDVLYLSLHEFPAYPGSGWVDEIGRGQGSGYTLNFPMGAGARGDAYRVATAMVAVPVLQQFAPDWILVSAGYDAHRADPLAAIGLEAADYAFMSAALRELVPSGRTIYFLEGGYDLEAIEESVAATLDPEAKAEEPPPLDSLRPAALRTLRLAADEARRTWHLG
jgi:acetoin utilization deacetylase AcuC-like enzyme